MDAGRHWRRAGWLSLAGLLLVVLATFRDYGISNDEEVQHVYGKLLIDFYRSGGADLSAFAYKNLYLYGGLFDMVAVLLAPLLPFHEYETRHLLSALSGLAGIAGTWRVGARLAGERAGFLAAAMLALTGVWWGGMFNNTKDVPFAATLIWTTWAILRLLPELPRPRLSSALLLGLTAGLGIGIRYGVVLAAVWLAAPVAMHLWRAGRADGWTEAGRQMASITVRLLPGLALFAALTALLWPWAMRAPGNVLEAFDTFRRFPYPITTILDGTLVLASEVPRYYLPAYGLIKLPLFYHAALVIGLLLAALGRGWKPVGASLLTVGLAAGFPLAYALIADQALYNGLRHFLFVVPPLAALAGVALDGVWRRLAERGGWGENALKLALGVTAATHLWELVALHPHQYVYYNGLVGGVAGAERRYEMDYWANSLREAALTLTAILEAEGPPPATPWRVAICAEALQFTTYAPPWLVPVTDWSQADFFAAPTQTDCDKTLQGPAIVEIRRMGALLGVVKDLRRR